MKVLILALALTLVGGQQDDYETDSEHTGNNRCLMYDYEAEVLNIIPGIKVDSAGIRLKSDVKVGNINSQERFLSFQSLDVFEYNGAYPEGRFVRSPKMSKSLEELKGQTATFQYTRGNIGNIKTDANLPTTLVNVVKGVAGLFSVNMKSKSKAYTVIEDTISGRCNATTYVQPDSRKPDEILVTKYMDCDDSVFKDVGATFFNPCKFCREKNNNFLASSTSQYKMKRMRDEYQIMEADVLESRTLVPSNEFSGSVIIQARQRFVYKRDMECSERVPSNLKNHGSLQFMFTDDLPPLPGPLLKKQDCGKQIEKRLKSLAQQPENSDKKSEIIQELLQAERICEKYPLSDTLANNAEYRNAVWSLVSSFKEQTKIKVLHDFIRGRMLPPVKTLILLLSCLWTSNPTLEALDRYKPIMEEYMQLPDAVGHTTAYYAYASLFGRYCDVSGTCSLSDLERLADLANMIHTSEEEKDILILKAYANVQNPVILKTIANFVPSCKSSPRSQYFALMAADDLCKKYPTKEVQLLALQTLMNHKCATPSRMMAIKILLQSQPSPATCITMAKAMETEPNNQVSNFFTSHLVAVARSKDPNVQEMVSVTGIFRQARPRISQFLDLCNRVSTSSTFSRSRMVDVENEFLFFSNGNDVIPNGVTFSSELRVHDEKHNLFEASVITFNKDNTFRRAGADDEDDEDDTQQSDQRTAPFKSSVVEGSLTMFGEKLLSGTLDDMIQGLKDPLKKWLHKQGTGSSSNIPLEMEDSMWLEAHCIVPTSVGLPLVVSATAYSQAELNGNAHLSIIPQLKPDFKLSDFMKANIKLQTKMDIRTDIDMQLAVGINTPHVQSVLVMDSTMVVKLPTNFAVKGNIWEKRFILETPPCEQKTEIFSVRSKTSSIKHCVEDTDSAPDHRRREAASIASRQDSDRSEEIDETEDIRDRSTERDSRTNWYNSGRSTSVHEPLCYDACTFGCKVCVKASSENSGCPLGDPRYKIFDDHTLSVSLQKSHTEAPIRKLRLMLQAGSQSPVQMEMSEEQNINDGRQSGNIDYEDQDENIEESDRDTRHGKKQSEKQSSRSHRKVLKKTVHRQEQSERWAEPEDYNSRNDDEYGRSNRGRDRHSDPSSRGSETSMSQETDSWDDQTLSHTIVVEADRADNKKQGYRYLTHFESKDDKLRTHIAANSLYDVRWKGSMDAVVSSSLVQVNMRYGDQSQDYRFEVKTSTGRGVEQPCIKMVAKCRDPSSSCIPWKLTQWFAESIFPQNRRIWGSLEDCEQNSSHDILLKIIEQAPYTVDVEVQLHGKTRYKETMCVPFDLHMDPQPHYQIPDLVSKIHSTKEFISWIVRSEEDSESGELNAVHQNVTSSMSK